MSCLPPAVQEHSAGNAPYEPWGHEEYWEQSDGEGWVRSAPFLLAKEAEPVPKGPACLPACLWGKEERFFTVHIKQTANLEESEWDLGAF